MIEQNSSLREKVRRVASDPAALSGLVGAVGLGIAAGSNDQNLWMVLGEAA